MASFVDYCRRPAKRDWSNNTSDDPNNTSDDPSNTHVTQQIQRTK